MIIKLHRKTIFLTIIVFLTFGCKPPFSQGKVLYETHCGNCHGKEGEGLRSLYPPIADSDYLTDNFESLTCIITKGMHKEITVNGKTYDGAMPGNKELLDVEISNIINYIGYTWYKEKGHISLDDIKKTMESCK